MNIPKAKYKIIAINTAESNNQILANILDGSSTFLKCLNDMSRAFAKMRMGTNQNNINSEERVISGSDKLESLYKHPYNNPNINTHTTSGRSSFFL